MIQKISGLLMAPFVCLCAEWEGESRGTVVQKHNGGVFRPGPVPEHHGHVVRAQDLRPEKQNRGIHHHMETQNGSKG